MSHDLCFQVESYTYRVRHAIIFICIQKYFCALNLKKSNPENEGGGWLGGGGWLALIPLIGDMGKLMACVGH